MAIVWVCPIDNCGGEVKPLVGVLGKVFISGLGMMEPGDCCICPKCGLVMPRWCTNPTATRPIHKYVWSRQAVWGNFFKKGAVETQSPDAVEVESAQDLLQPPPQVHEEPAPVEEEPSAGVLFKSDYPDLLEADKDACMLTHSPQARGAWVKHNHKASCWEVFYEPAQEPTKEECADFLRSSLSGDKKIWVGKDLLTLSCKNLLTTIHIHKKGIRKARVKKIQSYELLDIARNNPRQAVMWLASTTIRKG